MARVDYLVIMAVTTFLAFLGIYTLSSIKDMPPRYYDLISNIMTMIIIGACIVAAYCVFKFITYSPPERPYIPPMRPVQIPPSIVIYAARRSGRRPEEFMAKW